MVGTSNFGSWNGHWSWGKFCSPWAHWILPQYVSSGTLAQLWKPWPILVDLAYFPVPYLKLPNAKSHYIPLDVYIYIYTCMHIYIYIHMYVYIHISPWYPHDIPIVTQNPWSQWSRLQLLTPCPPRRAQADFEETEKKDAKLSKDELKECAAAVSGDHDS